MPKQRKCTIRLTRLRRLFTVADKLDIVVVRFPGETVADMTQTVLDEIEDRLSALQKGARKCRTILFTEQLSDAAAGTSDQLNHKTLQ
jgi:hypothetical protein